MDSGAHPASYLVDTGGSFLGTVVGVWSKHTSI